MYLYFLGPSLRNISYALEPLRDSKRSYVSVSKWIQRFCSSSQIYKRKRVFVFIVDEIIIQIGNENYWL
ncbi:MAG: hypothetical protein ACPKPY_00645 [Nitrososphaeraceae archaeon]